MCFAITAREADFCHGRLPWSVKLETVSGCMELSQQPEVF